MSEGVRYSSQALDMAGRWAGTRAGEDGASERNEPRDDEDRRGPALSRRGVSRASSASRARSVLVKCTRCLTEGLATRETQPVALHAEPTVMRTIVRRVTTIAHLAEPCSEEKIYNRCRVSRMQGPCRCDNEGNKASAEVSRARGTRRDSSRAGSRS